MRPRNTERNRSIFVAYQNGRPLEEIAQEFGVNSTRVQQIIREERYKLAYSQDAYYRVMRSQGGVPTTAKPALRPL